MSTNAPDDAASTAAQPLPAPHDVAVPSSPTPLPRPAGASPVALEPAASHKGAVSTAIGEPVEAGSPAGRRLYSPRVRHLAAEHGVGEADLATVVGSGLGGRVTADDLLAYLAGRPEPPAAPAAAAPTTARVHPPTVPALPAEGDAQIPLTPMRRAIAEHMVRSVTTAAHAWLAAEIDMSAVTRARADARAAFERAEGFGLTYLPYFVQAAVAALRVVPALNATWERDELHQRHEVNLGVAVAVEHGLLVPVIAGADGLNLTGLARAIRDRAERARASRLTPADMAGGTFTVNNTGAFGSILSRPIINQPQVAILTMEAIVRRLVVTADDAIAIRPMMHACLSYDQRALDAAVAGAFLAEVKDRLEQWTATSD
jgi:2-oxoisovalerate dehydrogenase E2 component (dihydrolipoyl transacylase)